MVFWKPSCTQKALFLHLHCHPPGPGRHRLRQQLVRLLEASACGGDAAEFHQNLGIWRVRCLRDFPRTCPEAARQTTLLNDETYIIHMIHISLLHYLSLKPRVGKGTTTRDLLSPEKKTGATGPHS